MKKSILSIFMAILFLGGGYLSARAEYISPIQIMSNAAVCPSGSSIWMIDLTRTNYEDAEMFALSFSGATARFVRPGSGVTMRFLVATSNIRPVGTNQSNEGIWLNSIQEVLNWQAVTPAMDVNTGNTAFTYPFKPEAGRFLLIKASNTGTTDYLTSAWLGFYRGQGWSCPGSILVSGVTSAFGTSGQTTFANTWTWPEGAKWVFIQPEGDDIHIGLSSASVITSNKTIADGKEYPMQRNEYDAKAWCTDAVANGALAADFYSDYPVPH